GATVYLAHRGMLDQVKHTSNALFYLKGLVSTYGGEVNYSNELAVSDVNIITASGIAPLEFTKEIMKELEFNSEYVERWYQLFKYGIFPTTQ
ncbi:MAG: type 1 glutamine amidotransferase family protein, partial [Flavobacterium sp.]